jgi:hypothetical protein
MDRESTNAHGTSPDDGEFPFVNVILALIGRSLALIPLSEADVSALNSIDPDSAEFQESSFFGVLRERKLEISTGLWGFYIALFCRDWKSEKAVSDNAVMLTAYRELYPSTGVPAHNELLDAVCGVLEGLSWYDYDEDREECSPVAMLGLLERLTKSTLAAGNESNAYDIVAIALDFCSAETPGREELARFGMSLALSANKFHQVAACAIAVAQSAVAAAELPGGELKAFDACEIAIERLMHCPKPFQAILAPRLEKLIRDDAVLRFLLPPLWFGLSDKPEGLPPILGGDWPPRVSVEMFDTWIGRLRPLLNAMTWMGRWRSSGSNWSPLALGQRLCSRTGRHGSLNIRLTTVRFRLAHPL